MPFFASPYLPVCLHVTIQEVLNGFYCNFVLGSSSNVCLHVFQFRLKSDNNDQHFTWKPTCVYERGSEWVGNPQSENSQPPAANPRREPYVMTSSPSKPLDTPSTHSSLAPKDSDVTSTIHKSQPSYSRERVRTVTPCAQLLTCFP